MSELKFDLLIRAAYGMADPEYDHSCSDGERERQSMSVDRTFRNQSDPAALLCILNELCETLSQRMRHESICVCPPAQSHRYICRHLGGNNLC